MPDPIEVNYVPDGDDWAVTVSGRGQHLTGKAPGLIAARDRADQLVEKVAPEEKFRTVVHMLEGDAVQFTNAYLTARLARPAEPAPAEEKKPAPTPKSKSKSTAKSGPKSGTDRKAPEPPTPREGDDAPSKAAANPGSATT